MITSENGNDHQINNEITFIITLAKWQISKTKMT